MHSMTADYALPPQTNRLVERLQQMIMCMIGKLGEDVYRSIH